MNRRLKSEAYYAEPIERVWQALTDPKQIALWLTRGEFRARRGHRFRWKEPASPTDGSECEIREVEAPRRLSFRLDHSPDAVSFVTWSLESVGEGTRVIIEQEIVVGSGLRPHPSVVSLALYRRQRSLLKIQSDPFTATLMEAA